ncbi:MAG: HAMP domain-containing histidine kinase [Halobacteriovoraceae bacterium]|jgi:C4-dicarboxylate-specific signal transduction histidine kinase|nr:HAMP domain-containing histidine kinase [Halobacteriovoraceae bacterium]MBT5095675.1 HAMP domain-containing histidine kinase [Halobacteriovoraceae bacterium]
MDKVAPTISKFKSHYKLAIGIVLLLSALGQVLVNWQLSKQSDWTDLKTKAQKLELTSQKLIQLTYRAKFSPQSFKKVREEFLLNLEQFKLDYSELKNSQLNSSELTVLYNVSDKDFSGLTLVFNCIADATCLKEDASKNIKHYLENKNHNEQFLSNLNEIKSRYTKQVEQSLDNLQIFGLILVSCILITLLYEITLVFEPAIKALGTEFEDKIKAEKASMEASQLAEMGTLSASIGHEVKNITMIVESSLKLLLKKVQKGSIKEDEILKFVERGISATGRLTEVTKALTRISRSETKQNMKVTKLKEIIQDAHSLCRDKANTLGVEIKINLQEDATVFANGVQISQVLLNLLTNSMHATTDLEEKWIEINSSVNQEGLVELRIIDSGEGIPKDIAEKLFDNFFTTKEAGEGTGLGMGISRAFVEQNKGTLIYQEYQGHTCFLISLKPDKAYTFTPKIAA